MVREQSSVSGGKDGKDGLESWEDESTWMNTKAVMAFWFVGVAGLGYVLGKRKA